MPYREPRILDQKLGNNAFAWEERMRKYASSPTLMIPSLINGDISDIEIGETIAFEEIEDGVLRSSRGLKHFVRISNLDNHEKLTNADFEGATESKQRGEQGYDEREQNESDFTRTSGDFGSFHSGAAPSLCGSAEIIIFDNHNHALFFWLDAVRRGIVKPGFELIHIDEHSDLWHNDYDLDVEKALSDETYAWEFTNLSCNVGNYIAPALRSRLVGKMIRIENEFQIDEYMEYTPPENSVLNVDLDIFAPELDHIDAAKKIRIIQHLLKRVKYVTIATSPYFIEQGAAIEKLMRLSQKI